MALPASGTLSLNEIHIEAGGTTATEAGINDADIRGLISKGSGVPMSFSEWYGASSTITASFVGKHTSTSSSSISVTCNSGDLILMSLVVGQVNTGAYINTPNGATLLKKTSMASNVVNHGKATSYYYSRAGLYCIKATSNNQTITTPYSWMGTQVAHVYRPSGPISSFSWTDNTGITSPANSISVVCGYLSAATLPGGETTANFMFGGESNSMGTLYDSNGGTNVPSSSGPTSGNSNYPSRLIRGYLTWS